MLPGNSADPSGFSRNTYALDVVPGHSGEHERGETLLLSRCADRVNQAAILRRKEGPIQRVGGFVEALLNAVPPPGHGAQHGCVFEKG